MTPADRQTWNVLTKLCIVLAVIALGTIVVIANIIQPTPIICKRESLLDGVAMTVMMLWMALNGALYVMAWNGYQEPQEPTE